MAGALLELSAKNFKEVVLDSSIPVVVDFWAAWCMPCKMIAPVIKELGEEYKDSCKIMKLNVDEAMEIATEFGVMNIPTIVFFKAGKEFTRLVGVVSKEEIVNKLEEMLA